MRSARRGWPPRLEPRHLASGRNLSSTFVAVVFVTFLALVTCDTVCTFKNARLEDSPSCQLSGGDNVGSHALSDPVTGATMQEGEALDRDLCLSLGDARRAHGPQHRIFVAVPLHFSNGDLSGLLDSLAMQEYPNLTVVIYDDASSDGSAELLAQEKARGTLSFELVVLRGEERLGPAHARWQLIRHILQLADSMDIVLFLDGDDRLFHAGVLREVEEAFRARKPWMAYGRMRGPYEQDCGPPSQPITYHTAPGSKLSPSSSVRSEWRYCHPRIFRAFMLRHYEEADFRDPDPVTNPNGRWLQKCTDCQLVFKGLELAGNDHVAFLDGPLPHVYYRVSSTATTFQLSRELRKQDNAYAYSRPAPSAPLPAPIHVVMCLDSFQAVGMDDPLMLLRESVVENLASQDVGTRPIHLHLALDSSVAVGLEAVEETLRGEATTIKTHRVRVYTAGAESCDTVRLELMRDAVRDFEAINYFVTLDTDVNLPAHDGLARLLASYARPREYNAWWGRAWHSLETYCQPLVTEADIFRGAKPGVVSWHYADMRLAVLDADLVRFYTDPVLEKLPRRYFPAVDLYLSYAAYTFGWQLRRIMMPGVTSSAKHSRSKLDKCKGRNREGRSGQACGSEDADNIHAQLFDALRTNCGWYI